MTDIDGADFGESFLDLRVFDWVGVLRSISIPVSSLVGFNWSSSQYIQLASDSLLPIAPNMFLGRILNVVWHKGHNLDVRTTNASTEMLGYHPNISMQI